MESGHTGLHYETVNLHEFLEKISRKFSGVAKEKGVSLTEDISVSQPECVFDEDKMEQVFTNLIDNALRHTESGGSVHIAAQTVKDGLKIDIKDSGSGIPEEDLPFIFERFYKADKARTRGRAGTGLGLAIVKISWKPTAVQLRFTAASTKGRRLHFIFRQKCRMTSEIDEQSCSIRNTRMFCGCFLFVSPLKI